MKGPKAELKAAGKEWYSNKPQIRQEYKHAMDYEMKNWKFDDGKKSGTGSISLDNKQQVVDNYVDAYNNDQENNAKFRAEIVQYKASSKAAKGQFKESFDAEIVPKYNDLKGDVQKAIHDI